ncbi:MAG: hypothetical protein U9R50_06410, partial [Campylobacterota bacterium]|nr:hypothetical protein [Campylobacterota bacterium]
MSCFFALFSAHLFLTSAIIWCLPCQLKRFSEKVSEIVGCSPWLNLSVNNVYLSNTSKNSVKKVYFLIVDTVSKKVYNLLNSFSIIYNLSTG